MQRHNHLPQLSKVLALVLCGALAAMAEAVVISTGNDLTNLTAPGDDPGWDNVTYLGNASAVYLGNRWMLTAGHVSDGALRFSDGRESIPVSYGSKVSISNPNGSRADLRMFRLAEDPGLPALEIASSSPTAGTIVTMIGAGLNRDSALVAWNVDSLGAWTEARFARGQYLGYQLLQTSSMRWGVNQVQSGAPTLLSGSNTFGFSTRFDRPGIPFEAQATVGDSGGGVFEFVDGSWKLAGIMDTIQTLNNQPGHTAVFTTTTNSADLSVYRDQILSIVNLPEPFWQNQFNHFDVDGSGRVNAQDALLVISELLSGPLGTTDLPVERGNSEPFFDVTGDRRFNTQDALQLVSALLNKTANPPASSSVTALSSEFFVPEPSSAVLAVVVLACFAPAVLTVVRRKRRNS